MAATPDDGRAIGDRANAFLGEFNAEMKGAALRPPKFLRHAGGTSERVGPKRRRPA
jgi:hypothetical protein